jgi:hypothetical protein
MIHVAHKGSAGFLISGKRANSTTPGVQMEPEFN